MIGDLNAAAARPRRTTMAPLEIPVSIEVVPGRFEQRAFHLLSDHELDYFIRKSERGEGWRWARSIARLLAGEPPEER